MNKQVVKHLKPMALLLSQRSGRSEITSLLNLWHIFEPMDEHVTQFPKLTVYNSETLYRSITTLSPGQTVGRVKKHLSAIFIIKGLRIILSPDQFFVTIFWGM